MTLKSLPDNIRLEVEKLCPPAVFEEMDAIGREVLSIRENNTLDTELKSDRSPVTQADMYVHNRIRDILDKAGPELDLLSEENHSDYRAIQAQPEFWILDPLDGTREYINGSDEFGVALARIEAGKAVFGLIYAPATRELYFGVNNGPAATAWRYADRRWQELRPSGRDKIAKVVVSRSHLDEQTMNILKNYGNPAVTQMGSCLKFCQVAAGLFDAYIKANSFYIWDVAAGQAIVEAAGGALKDIAGNRVLYHRGLKVHGIFAVNDKRLS